MNISTVTVSRAGESFTFQVDDSSFRTTMCTLDIGAKVEDAHRTLVRRALVDDAIDEALEA